MERLPVGPNTHLQVNQGLCLAFGPEFAVFIANLYDQEPSPNTWFVLGHVKQMNQTGMSQHAIRKCKKMAQQLGFLRTKLGGLPCKEWYLLDPSKNSLTQGGDHGTD